MYGQSRKARQLQPILRLRISSPTPSENEYAQQDYNQRDVYDQ